MNKRDMGLRNAAFGFRSSIVSNHEEHMALTIDTTAVLRASGGATSAKAAARASQSGIWVGMFAITMSFAAFTSALYIRQASTDWTHIATPRILFLNTFFLILSSALLEMSRRTLRPDSQSQAADRAKGGLLLAVSLLLGVLFVIGQYSAWRQLRAQGLYLATTPNSSFFYLLTGAHALHLLGGLAALIYLYAHLAVGRGVRRNLLNGVVTYWHFMALLWLYLLLVIFTRL
jgi:cytochrome c oxidase subunit III